MNANKAIEAYKKKIEELETKLKTAVPNCAKFKKIFYSSPDAIVIINSEGVIEDINKKIFEWLGYTREEVIGKKITELPFIEEGSKAKMLENFNQRIAGKNVPTYTATFTEKDSTNHVGKIRGELTRDDEGNVTGEIILIEDITEQSMAEQAMMESEYKYRGLYESIKDGIVRGDLEGKIVECNKSFKDMLGYSESELKKMTFYDFTPKKWYEMENEIINNQVLKRGYSDEYEKEYITKDGSTIPVSLRVWLLKDDNDEATGMWAIVRDIREEKKAMKKVEKEKAEVERLNEIMLGREVRIAELKKEIARLKKKLSK